MEEKQQNQRKIWLNIIIVVVILLTVLTVVGSMHDLNALLLTLQQIDMTYFFIALLLGLVSFFLMSLSSQIVLRALNKELPYLTGFLIQAVEPFFNGITPFSSGAQPFQLYYYHKHKVEGNQATSILVVNFILFQIVSVLLTTLGLIIFWQEISNALGLNIIYLMVGYSINTLILVGLFLLAYVKKAYILFEKLFQFFERFKWTKKRAAILKSKTLGFVVKFQDGVKFLFGKKRVFILGSFVKLLSLLVLYSTTIFIALSLGYTFSLSENIFMIVAGLLAVTTMMFVPLPGASGGTEVAFAGLMSALFIDSEIILSLVSLMLIWRVTTYYFGMMYGVVAYIILQRMQVKL